jgi:ABC-2 type transport system ATP-binding protein
VIEVESLTQAYGRYVAVRSLGFRVDAGEVVGFLGPNGAGKTTTLKVIAGFLSPTEGRVRVRGHDVARSPLEVRRVLGYLPEHCPLYEEMLVRELLLFVAGVRGLERAARAAALGKVVERCALGDVLFRPVSELSKGDRQRVGIAAALLHEPPILVLDEPTGGLDPNQVLEVRELVRALGRERTVLFSSHVLSEVEATCRRVLVIHQGRLVADSPLDALRERARGGALRVSFSSPSPALREALRALPGVARVDDGDGAWVVHPSRPDEELAGALFRFAVAQGVELRELAPRAVSLEDVFQTLTGRSAGQAGHGEALRA